MNARHPTELDHLTARARRAFALVGEPPQRADALAASIRTRSSTWRSDLRTLVRVASAAALP